MKLNFCEMLLWLIGTFSPLHYYIHAYTLAAVRIILLVLNHNHQNLMKSQELGLSLNPL